MRAWMRIGCLAAALLAGIAGCGDVLAPPAAGGARLDLRAGPPSRQTSGDTIFDTVDELVVYFSRRQVPVLADSFAVVPANGEIRSTIVVPVEGDEDFLELNLLLRRRNVNLYSGSTVVTLVRGQRTIAEVPLFPIIVGFSAAPVNPQ